MFNDQKLVPRKGTLYSAAFSGGLLQPAPAPCGVPSPPRTALRAGSWSHMREL